MGVWLIRRFRALHWSSADRPGGHVTHRRGMLRGHLGVAKGAHRSRAESSMWFWRIYLGLAAASPALTWLGLAGSGPHVPSRTSASDHQSTRTGPRHRRDV